MYWQHSIVAIPKHQYVMCFEMCSNLLPGHVWGGYPQLLLTNLRYLLWWAWCEWCEFTLRCFFQICTCMMYFYLPDHTSIILPATSTPKKNIWVFPKIGVPPNHPFVHRVFHYKPSILGYHYFWKHPYTTIPPNSLPLLQFKCCFHHFFGRRLMGFGRPRGAAPKLCRTGSAYLNLRKWRRTQGRRWGVGPTWRSSNESIHGMLF